MNMILSWLRKHIFLLPLLLILSLIAFLNYAPGTIISGWDTLHPEFDFGLNFQRLIFGVWRDNQGLGAVAGHSHMADLPRVFIMWVMDIFLKTEALRFGYLALCLFAGPLGIYFLVNHLLKNKSHTELISFLASIFYILNLSAVQQFYVPFEMFTTQYAALPWIIYFSIKFLEKTNKLDLFLFALVTLLATPQAYAAHLWFPFFGVYTLFLVMWGLLHKKTIKIKKIIALIAVTLLINSFWLLPNLYYIKTTSFVPRESKQNRIYSQEYRLRNRDQGYLQDVALIRGFYFNWQIYDFEKERMTNLMPEWDNHLKNPFVSVIGYIFFAGVIAGFIYSIKKRDKVLISLSPFLIVPFVLLLNHTFLFEQFFNLLTKISLFEEALRFVFTKLSILILLAYTIYLAKFLQFIFTKKQELAKILPLLIVASLVIYTYPIFKGDLISQKMEIKIPQDYKNFWTFMKTQPDGLVLTLPLHTFSGWQYYNWGYQGAGFMWFDLKQPLLDRDFDRWSIANEQSFREFHYSVYARNSDYFAKNLEKFNVQYIVWDQNIISPTEKNRNQIIYKREIDGIISDLTRQGILQEIKRYGRIITYKVEKNTKNVAVENITNNVGPIYRWNFFDRAYMELGEYITSDKQGNQNNYYFPFRNITTPQERVRENLINSDENIKTFYLKNESSQDFPFFHVPSYYDTESTILVDVLIQRVIGNNYKIIFKPLLPSGLLQVLEYETNLLPNQNMVTFTINGQRFFVNNNQINTNKPVFAGSTSIFTARENYFNNLEFNPLPGGRLDVEDNLLSSISFPVRKNSYDASKINELNPIKKGVELKGDILEFNTKNFHNGVYIPLNDLNHSLGYVLVFNSHNINGLPLRICLRNNYSNICTLYDELSKSENFTKDYFFIPPIDDGFGYGLSIENISYGNYETRNELKEVYVVAFPYSFASEMYYSGNNASRTLYNTEAYADAYKSLPYLYAINILPESIEKNSVLTLNQAFHPGWIAYQVKSNDFFSTHLPFIFGSEIKDHVLVNNWSNGWRIDQKTDKVMIIFWPQYLEYLGFILVFLTLVSIFAFMPKKKDK